MGNRRFNARGAAWTGIGGPATPHSALRTPYCRARCRLARGAVGQAAVETAIILPLMVFMVLGIIQLTLIQQARLMTEHAAFNAARAGIVWNANNDKMVNAAMITLVPALPIMKKNDIFGSLLSFAKWGLIAQATHLTDKGIATLEGFAQQLNIPLKGVPDISLVQVEMVNPKLENWDKDLPNEWNKKNEIDFDEVFLNSTSNADAEKLRQFNRMTIRTRFLYPMRIPFANWTIHTAYMAQVAGVRLTGPIERPMLRGEKWNQQSRALQTIEGNLKVDPLQMLFGDKDRNLLTILWQLHENGLYLIPLRATYTMRMQSNIFKDNLNEGF